MVTAFVIVGCTLAVTAFASAVLVFRIRRSLQADRLRTALEERLNPWVAPLRADIGSATVSDVTWTHLTLSVRNLDLCSKDGHRWVRFGRASSRFPIIAVLFPGRPLDPSTPWRFSETTVDAVPGQDPIEDLRGTVTPAGDGMVFAVAGGRWAETFIETGRIDLSGFKTDPFGIEIALQGRGGAGEAVRRLQMAPFSVSAVQSVAPEAVRGEVRIEIHAVFQGSDLAVSTYSVKADIDDLDIPRAGPGLDLTAGRLAVTASNSGFRGEGHARLAGAPVSLNMTGQHGAPTVVRIDMPSSGDWFNRLTAAGRLSGGRLEAVLRECPPAAWAGTVSIQDLRITRAPLLSRLLTMASLPGLLSALTTNGLVVTRAAADIRFHPDTVGLTGLHLSIDQLEITGDVKIDLRTRSVSGSGLLVPAAALQRLAPKVPLLGAFLDGLGAGARPLVATRFSLSGPVSDPQVTVTPLERLTAEMLRALGLTDPGQTS